ncbi:MAG: thioredoxin domain-containing protein [Negativicutes bacterium]
MAKIEHTNRLINEKSPYLLQHAHNPIDWYPWGEEAFAKAKAEDKPVFLSVGYSTCHWCHVMEMECFEDEELAQIMNSSFVAIKVDKEERPDIDRVYMGVCQALTGQGGWPLTIIMTPDKNPVFAGTYFPKQSTSKQPGLMQVLMVIREKWTTNRDELLLYGQQVVKTLQSELQTFEPSELKRSWVDDAFAQFCKDFDKDFGGFGMSPKFPAPYNLVFLLYYWKKTGNEQALSMVEKTLSAMRRGGIYDHIGYGFSRYSVDRKWLVPHFEKMLYDNAMLCCLYLDAYQCTEKSDYSQVAEEIIAYVLRVLDDPQGGFYSAEDADSEGREGQFYVWSLEEILQCLGEEQGKIFADFYGVTAKGNFEQDANILHSIDRDVAEYASGRNMSVEKLTQLLRSGRETLFEQREKRIHPFKDDKILTAWNALMIVALAKAARILNQPEYARRAKRCLDFIYEKLFRQDGRLMARYRDGSADYPAYLDDYAYLLWALVEMYEATFAPEHLVKAQHLAEEMQRLFADTKQGGFFFSGTDNEVLITRPKELYDSCIPSGNSVALLAMVRLGRYTGNIDLLQTTERMLQSFAGEVDKFPRFYPGFLLALEQYQAPLSQIIIAGQKNDDVAQAMIAAVGRYYLPTTVVMVNDPSDSGMVETVLPGILNYKPVNGRPAAYICENYTCQVPYSNVVDFIQAIEKMQEKRTDF